MSEIEGLYLVLSESPVKVACNPEWLEIFLEVDISKVFLRLEVCASDDCGVYHLLVEVGLSNLRRVGVLGLDHFCTCAILFKFQK